MALKQHSSTLVDLYLLIRGYDPLRAPFDDLAYDSFRSFTSLKTLSIHPSDCIRHRWDFEQTDTEDAIEDTLPKSLEAFKVIEWSTTMKRGLLRLGEAATQGDHPNLKLLEVQCHGLNKKALANHVDWIKKDLQDFNGDSIAFPLQISAYAGNELNPSERSLLHVWNV
ncbi:hypothetical protein ColLi_11876 [Colletotrichum liriopes]|uniref:Uncharacterized protein n=1 Tax=Colletotrichum liriopes TaxID=708192 RepID=A0AA37LZ26_9PEZI|nr:hypothetical protein ColLi_11876 [Colletotrichum liriopes]